MLSINEKVISDIINFFIIVTCYAIIPNPELLKIKYNASKKAIIKTKITIFLFIEYPPL